MGRGRKYLHHNKLYEVSYKKATKKSKGKKLSLSKNKKTLGDNKLEDVMVTQLIKSSTTTTNRNQRCMYVAIMVTCTVVQK